MVGVHGGILGVTPLAHYSKSVFSPLAGLSVDDVASKKHLYYYFAFKLEKDGGSL